MLEGELKTEKVHELRLTARRAEAALRAIEDALAVTGADLRSLSMRPLETAFEVTLRIAGLEDEAAERASNRLALRPGVTRVRLEHSWVRP